MLERLDRIDWANLGHAYGEASDVPGQIRALLSPDAKAREGALWSLYGNIFHQGTRYEATAHAVPFLFEMAESPATPDRHRLLGLLVDLALGYAEEYLPFGMDPDEVFSPDADAEADKTEEDDEFGGDWVEWARAAYEAVEAGTGLFVKWTRDPDAQVRAAAVYALAWFPRRARGSVTAVRHVATTEPDPLQRANALLSLALLDRALGEGAGEDAELFTGLLREGNPPPVRLAAAIALGMAAREGGGLPAEATAVLLAAVGGSCGAEGDGGDGGEEQPVLLHWNDGDLVGVAGLVLVAAGGAHSEDRERVVEALCAALPAAAPMSSLTLTGALLDVTLRETPGTPPQVPDTWTPLQKRALEAIAEHGAWRVGIAQFGNYGSLLDDYGLPGSEERFREFVAALPPAG